MKIVKNLTWQIYSISTPSSVYLRSHHSMFACLDKIHQCHIHHKKSYHAIAYACACDCMCLEVFRYDIFLISFGRFIQQKLGGPSASEYEKLQAEMSNLQIKYDELVAEHQETCKEVRLWFWNMPAFCTLYK